MKTEFKSLYLGDLKIELPKCDASMEHKQAYMSAKEEDIVII